MGSKNVMGLGYGSNTSVNTVGDFQGRSSPRLQIFQLLLLFFKRSILFQIFTIKSKKYS